MESCCDSGLLDSMLCSQFLEAVRLCSSPARDWDVAGRHDARGLLSVVLKLSVSTWLEPRGREGECSVYEASIVRSYLLVLWCEKGKVIVVAVVEGMGKK